MRADVIQMVSLATHAAPYLSGAATDAPELLGTHGSFTGVQNVEFDRPGFGPSSGLVANAVSPWIKRLRKESAESIQLMLRGLPFSMNEPFDGIFGLVTDSDRGVEIWTPEWERRSVKGAPGPIRHNVAYICSRVQRMTLGKPVALSESLRLLEGTVDEIIELASSKNALNLVLELDYWKETHENRSHELGSKRLLLPDTANATQVSYFGSVITLTEVFESTEWTSTPLPNLEKGRILKDQAFQGCLGVLEQLSQAA